MKRVLQISLGVLLVVGLCSPVLAAKAGKKAEKKYERIVAYVDSLDVDNRTIVVTREENQEVRTIKISEKAASVLKVGDRIRIKLKAGTNESAGVRVLGAKPGAAAPVEGEENVLADGVVEPEPEVK